MFKSKPIAWITTLTLLGVAGVAIACRLKDSSKSSPKAEASSWVGMPGTVRSQEPTTPNPEPPGDIRLAAYENPVPIPPPTPPTEVKKPEVVSVPVPPDVPPSPVAVTEDNAVPIRIPSDVPLEKPLPMQGKDPDPLVVVTPPVTTPGVPAVGESVTEMPKPASPPEVPKSEKKEPEKVFPTEPAPNLEGLGENVRIVPVSATNPRVVESFSEEEYTVQPDDTYATVSKKKYGSEKYAEALGMYNRNDSVLGDSGKDLKAGQVIAVPDARILEKRYGNLIAGDSPPVASSKNPSETKVMSEGSVPTLPEPSSLPQGKPESAPASVAPPNANVIVEPATSEQPLKPQTPVVPSTEPIRLVPEKPPEHPRYTVGGKGETLEEIARRTLGSTDRWREILDLNPDLKAELVVPVNKNLRLPLDAKVDKTSEKKEEPQGGQEAEDVPPLQSGTGLRPLPVVRTRTMEKTGKGGAPMTGTFTGKLDDKRCLVLPKEVLEQMGKGETVLLTPGPDRCLWICTQASATRMLEKMEKSSLSDADVQAFRRFYFAQSEKVSMDGEGKMTVPAALAEYSGLGKDVVLIGIDDHFEMWDAARWNRYTRPKESGSKSGE